MLSAGAEQRSVEILSQLSEKDRTRVIALPYRVGLYVSHADKTGGSEAEAREIETLERILTEISEDFCKSEIMQKIMLETVKHKNSWSRWTGHLDKVPEECRVITAALDNLVEQKGDSSSVKDTLIDIGVAVAMSFQEYGAEDYPQESALNTIMKSAHAVLGGFIPSLKPYDRFDHMRISPAERKALMTLVKSMGL